MSHDDWPEHTSPDLYIPIIIFSVIGGIMMIMICLCVFLVIKRMKTNTTMYSTPVVVTGVSHQPLITTGTPGVGSPYAAQSPYISTTYTPSQGQVAYPGQQPTLYANTSATPYPPGVGFSSGASAPEPPPPTYSDSLNTTTTTTTKEKEAYSQQYSYNPNFN